MIYGLGSNAYVKYKWANDPISIPNWIGCASHVYMNVRVCVCGSKAHSKLRETKANRFEIQLDYSR